jgi:hypothetical protein
VLRAALVLADLLQQQRGPYPERLGQRYDGLETRIHMTGFQPAEHAGADTGVLRDVGKGQIELYADAACNMADACRHLGAIDQRSRREIGRRPGGLG